jgi:MSHA biogenesis protein MshP
MTSVFETQNGQRGFTLIAALFILLGLAVFGSYLLSMSTVQSMNSALVLKGSRGFQAASSGIEWGIARAAAGNCSGSTSFTVPGTGFSVSVSCQAQSFSEGGSNYNVYRLVSLAESGSYGSEDYVSRSLETKVTGP